MRFSSPRLFICALAAFSQVGCVSMYGTPGERMTKNAQSSSYSLCLGLAQATLAPYQVREEWARELQRRGENCSQYSNAISATMQQNQQQMQLGLQLLSPPVQQAVPAGGGVGGGAAFLKREYTSGFNKICVYDRLGSEVAVTIGAAQICPLSLR